MESRINPYLKGNGTVSALFTLGSALNKSPLEKNLVNLVYYRVSQINGCAYCLDMHSKDLLAAGENPQRLYVMDAWREAPFYTDRERAAFAWAEAVTMVIEGHVPDEVYEQARKQFTETELIDLTMAVIGINSYNRINIAFRTPAGNYRVGEHAELTK